MVFKICILGLQNKKLETKNQLEGASLESLLNEMAFYFLNLKVHALNGKPS